jgi:membrane protein required for colicin V production
MPVDIILIVLLCIAVWKGYSKGFVVAIFSFFSIIIGLAAAVKLSAIVANWLGTATGITQKWLPILAFLVVIIAVALIVRLVAKMIETTVELALLGWVNKLLGILFFALLYVFIYSVVLFYSSKIGLISVQAIEQSKTYSFIQPLGPFVIDVFGKIIPIFKDLFEQLTAFFDEAGKKVT